MSDEFTFKTLKIDLVYPRNEGKKGDLDKNMAMAEKDGSMP